MKILLVSASALALATPAAVHARSTDVTDPSSTTAPTDAAQPDRALTDIVIVGQRRPQDATVAVQESGISAPDAAELAARLPGADVASNGALSGRLQYRGVSNDRLLVRIDGQRFQTGSPNAMDPPLHYAPLPLLGSVTVDRGVSPVRDGPGLGGGFDAKLKTVEFGTSDRLDPQVDATGSYSSADDGWSVGGIAGVASDRFRLGVIGSHEEGDDRGFPGGTVRDSAYSRDVYGVQAEMQTGAGRLDLEFRQQDTGHAGTPALPMDILFFHTTFLNAHSLLNLSDDLHLDAALGYSDVNHAMDNFSLRPAPGSPMGYRRTDVDADNLSGHANFTLGSAAHHLGFGADFEVDDRDAAIGNPNNGAFYVGSIPNVTMNRFGGYLEWRTAAGPIQGEFGARYDHHEARAGEPQIGPVLPPPAQLLARRFAAADRTWSADTVDVVARLWFDQGAITPRLTLAHKTRAPNAVERYSWLPIEVSGGLADGNIYVGDLNLRPEQAWVAEAGLDWRTNGFYARPTAYYRRIDGYVQGVPYDATPGVIDTPVEMVAGRNGDPTPLRFANVDAEIYGADMDFGARIAGPLRIDGSATYVRGRRRDIDDDLYRIAPPNLRLDATWEAARWSLTAEGVGYTRQTHVSRTNGEDPSPGYVVANLFGEVELGGRLSLSAGVDNLFDKRYAPHLAGYNRVADSDVPVGVRLPANGRAAFVRLNVHY